MADGQKPRPVDELITMAMSLAQRAGTRLGFDPGSVQPERLRVNEQEAVPSGVERLLTRARSAWMVQSRGGDEVLRSLGRRRSQTPDRTGTETGPILDRFWTDFGRGCSPRSLRISFSVLSGALGCSRVLTPAEFRSGMPAMPLALGARNSLQRTCPTALRPRPLWSSTSMWPNTAARTSVNCIAPWPIAYEVSGWRFVGFTAF